MDKLLLFLFVILRSLLTNCDIYFHNPRGSNNRLDEATRNRANGNRLFNSQNNDRGGYNVGSVYYYVGSKLQLEWTNQHSCMSPNNHCELVIQYMCHDLLRDGTTTSQIPENPTQCSEYDCNHDFRYGMHETYDYYLTAKLRKRNRGLFTADQKLKKKGARSTRQNPGGTRRGYECPEERDYYPYWHPTGWKDIVVMTNDATRCPYYQRESENVKSRFACSVPFEVMEMEMHGQEGIIPNNKEECEAFRWPANNPNGTVGKWMEYPPHGIPPPDCRETQFTRDNHLGNGIGGYPNTYNWTIPDDINEHCTLRIRYNISTGDYDAWNTDASSNTEIKKKRDYNNPSKKIVIYKGVDIATQLGFENASDAAQRGYVYTNNPVVQIFPDYDLKLRLAINTAQFGRTFQDRSHTFAIRKRPIELSGATIHNVNVRGKRGNIVQVYPGVEYDFVPNTLQVSKSDYIHFQWTGSNTNPDNNDGQGRAGSDRSNVVLQDKAVYEEGNGIFYANLQKMGHWGRSYPMHIGKAQLLGLTQSDLVNLAILNTYQYGGEMSELDDAGTYFDLKPVKVTQSGIYHYMCTRNNNFSNRSQKGKLIARDQAVMSDSIGWNGGNITLPSRLTGVYVDRGTLDDLHLFSLEEWKVEQAEVAIEALNKEMPPGDGFGSNVLLLYPQEKITPGENKFSMKIDRISGSDVSIYRSNTENYASWEKLEANIENGVAEFSTDRGGVYVARTETNVGAIVGITIACVAILCIVIGTIVYFRTHRSKLDSLTQSIRNARRGVQSSV